METQTGVTKMFSTYKDAKNWIDAETAKRGKAFTASQEYKAAYAEIAALYAAEFGKRTRKPRVEMPIFGSSLLLHAAGMK